MKRSIYFPSERLRPFVKNYVVIESTEEMINRVVPGTSVAMAFRFKGQVGYMSEHTLQSLPSSVMSGLRKSVRLINYLQESASIIVLFREGGASAFFKPPLHELFEESVSLDHFMTTQEVSIIEEQLAEAKDNQQRIYRIEQLLLSKLFSYKSDLLIEAAVANITSHNGLVRIKELTHHLCLSQDALEKRFRKSVGTTLKQFSSIVRLNSVIRQKHPEQTLSDLALDGGYFDQSHFSKDFKLFTGQTPKAFFQSPSFW